MKKTIKGFTLVELLIVIVVIAILAAISVVAYNGIQNRAYDTSVEADIANIKKKMELARVDLGHYPRSEAEFPSFKINKPVYDITANNIYYCLDIPGDTYALGLRSKSMKGYIASPGALATGVTVHGAATCSVIGKIWQNDATTYVTSGWYSATVPPSWNSVWGWTN